MANLRTKNINCKLYMEGVLVPFTSLQISERMDAPPTCTIAFPASSKAIKVLAGTIVHIFGDVQGVENGTILTRHVLLFEGEVSGLSYQKNAEMRSVSVSCESVFHRWANVFKQSSDILSNKSYLASLYVITSLDYLNDLPEDPSEEKAKIDKKIFEDTKNRYHRFTYSNDKSIGGFAHFMKNAWAVDEEAKNVGDWYPFFKSLIESVEALNYFYGLLAKTFKITDTLFVFPNVTIKEALDIMLANESMLSSSATIGESVSIIQIMTSILQTINYQMLFPASYTYTHSLVQKDTEVPIRAYFLPDIKWGPPLKNNIIFPSEAESVSYTRHMSAEPTRLMAGTPPFELKDAATSLFSTKAWFLAPGLNFLKINNSSEESKAIDANKGLIADEYVLSFSPEESYRGVKAETTGLQGLEDTFIRNLWKTSQEDKSPDEDIAKAFGASTGGVFAMNAAVLSLYGLKYGSRACSISATWNPFRVVGFPALVFDLDDSPPIMGVLASHTTTISAAGEARSSMSLAYPRTVWDAGNADDVESLLSYQVGANSGTALDDVYKYNSFEEDPIPFLEGWLDPKWYGSAHVGRDVYSIVAEGKRSRRTETAGDTSWHGDGSSMEKYFDIYDVDGKRGRYIDSSIFSFIRNSTTGGFETRSEDSLYSIDEDDPTHIVLE